MTIMTPTATEATMMIINVVGSTPLSAKHNAQQQIRPETSNLRKAYVMRDSSGPATSAISVGLQQ